MDAGTQLSFFLFSLRLQPTGWLDLHSWWVCPPQFCLSGNTPGECPPGDSKTTTTQPHSNYFPALCPAVPGASAPSLSALCSGQHCWLSASFPPHALCCSFLPGCICLLSFIVGTAAVQSLKDSSLICNFYAFSLGEFLNLLAFS